MKKFKILLYGALLLNIVASILILTGCIYSFVTQPDYMHEGFDISPLITILFILSFHIYIIKKSKIEKKTVLVGISATIFSLVVIYLSRVFSYFYFFDTNFSWDSLFWMSTHSMFFGYAFWPSAVALLLNILYFVIIAKQSFSCFMKNEWNQISKFSKAIRIFYISFTVISLIISIVVINIISVNKYLQIPFWQTTDKEQVTKIFSEIKDKTVSYKPTNLFDSDLYIYSPLGLALMYSKQDVVQSMFDKEQYNDIEPISTLLVNTIDISLYANGTKYTKVKRYLFETKRNIKQIFDSGIKFSPNIDSEEAGKLLFTYAKPDNEMYQYMLEEAIKHGLNISAKKVINSLALGGAKFNKNIYKAISPKLNLNEENHCDFAMKKGFSLQKCSNLFVILSAMRPNIEFIKILNKYQKIDFNIVDNDERTPLMYASYRNDSDYVDYLLSQGVNISLKDKFGKTAFDYAIEGGIKNGGGIIGDSFANFLNVWLKYQDLSDKQLLEIEKNDKKLTTNTNSIKVTNISLVDSNNKEISSQNITNNNSSTKLHRTIAVYKNIQDWNNLLDIQKSAVNTYCHRYDWKICNIVPKNELKSFDKIYCKISYQMQDTLNGISITPHILEKEYSPAKNIDQCYDAYKELKRHFVYDREQNGFVGETRDGRIIFDPSLKISYEPIAYDDW